MDQEKVHKDKQMFMKVLLLYILFKKLQFETHYTVYIKMKYKT